MKKTKIALIALASTVFAACSVSSAGPNIDQLTADVVKSSFQAKGIATLDRLKQDEANRLCSEADVAGKPLDEKMTQVVQETSMKTIKWPADGKYLGDWKVGEKVAQSGKGLSWSDKADRDNGGNCYNCHQITKEEISFGTIGPSLYNYGKLRGVTDPDSPAGMEIVKYTWGKMWNARATNACSLMPRFGHNDILDEQQIKDVMALLLDPASPVNK
jgi:sulfur-oxidizing protein SoxX